MKNILFIISLFYLLNCIDLEGLWNQAIYRKSKYSLIDNNNYFIFQENDYIVKEIIIQKI